MNAFIPFKSNKCNNLYQDREDAVDYEEEILIKLNGKSDRVIPDELLSYREFYHPTEQIANWDYDNVS